MKTTLNHRVNKAVKILSEKRKKEKQEQQDADDLKSEKEANLSKHQEMLKRVNQLSRILKAKKKLQEELNKRNNK